MAKTLAHEAAKMFCMAPDIGDLSPIQLSALHVFKHEVIASAFRLYMVVPQDKADKILAEFFKKLPGQLE